MPAADREPLLKTIIYASDELLATFVKKTWSYKIIIHHVVF